MKNGNKIAVIEYDIEEYVSGDFGNGMMAMFSKDKSDKKTFMKMSHKANTKQTGKRNITHVTSLLLHRKNFK